MEERDSSRKQTILVVDDTPDNLTLMNELLKDAYKVKLANGGERALRIASTDPQPDLILLDVMMPGMDGYETIRAIREMAEFQSLPIIAVTAKAMKGDREKCLESGASDYIAKPVELEQLFSLLRVWMPERRGTASGAGLSA